MKNLFHAMVWIALGWHDKLFGGGEFGREFWCGFCVDLLVIALPSKKVHAKIHTIFHAAFLGHFLSPPRMDPRRIHATPKIIHANFTPPFPLLL